VFTGPERVSAVPPPTDRDCRLTRGASPKPCSGNRGQRLGNCLVVYFRGAPDKEEVLFTDSQAQRLRRLSRAFAAGDRETVERALADDFRFSSPLDVGLDRQNYFERCWPGAGQGQEFEFERVIESGDEVTMTYELRQTNGSRGRNTEILTFEDDQVREVKVYFGWNIE
jgi:hypothetical protein